MLPEQLDPYPGDAVEHLRSFLLLARRIEADPRGAFDATALALHLDASVLRRRVQTLGEWLGGDLLAGRGSRLRVTARGGRVVETAARVLAELGRLREALAGAAAPVAIGATGTVITELLPPALGAVRARWPEVEVRIRRSGTEASQELIRRGELDIAVVRGERPPPGFSHRRLCPDRLWAAIPTGHPLARARRIARRDLAAPPIISYRPGSFTRRRVMEPLAPLGGRVHVEVDGKAAALRYVELGLGVAFLSLVPGHRVAAEGVRLREVTRHFPRAAFFLIWAPGRELRPTERFLVERLLAAVRVQR